MKLRRVGLVGQVMLLCVVLAGAFAAFPLTAAAQSDPLPKHGQVLWLNHFDLLPGGAEVTTSYESTSSGVGGGLTALVIHSSTLGDTFATGGNKVVHMAVTVPPHFDVKGVRVCYELTSSKSFITQVRLAQVQDPPATALVLLDDATDLTDPGPICLNSDATDIDPRPGALLISLRVNFGNTSDKIAVRGLALFLKK